MIRFYKKKNIVILVSIIFLFYCISYEYIFKIEPTGNEFKIVKKIKKENYYTYYVKEGHNKYMFYNAKELDVGDVITCSYKIEEFTNSQTPNGFNMKKYYGSKRIFYKLIAKDIKIIESNFNINKIKEFLLNKLDNYPKTVSKYLNLFLFSNDTFIKEFQEAKVSLGIVHLFALSGLHVNFLLFLIDSITKRFNIEINKYFMFVILLIYSWFGNFSIGLLRVATSYIIYNIFKEKGLTRLDSLSLSFLLILTLNPFYRFRTGFVLTFLISFMLLVVPFKNNFKGMIKRHLMIVFSSLLILSNINLKVFPLSIITSFIFTLIFPIIILPLVYLSLVPFLSIMIDPLLAGFNNLILTIETNIYFKIPYQSLLSICIYISIFVFIIFSDNMEQYFKRGFFLILYIVFLYVSPNFDFNSKIYFLDVNQGDATFIQNKFNEGNILIDANKGTIDFLRTLGNIGIEYFFITHGDSDHAIEAKVIIDEFDVKNIIVSPYDNSEIIKGLKDYNLQKANINDFFSVNGVEIKVIGPLNKYNNLNNNSLVLKLEMFNKTYLFTGDIEKEAVEDLVSFYKEELKSDVLHVSHHGAFDGTPLNFLKYVRPEKAIISVGKNNIYNHPHEETIKNLNLYSVKIYFTSKQQTIIKRKYRFSF